MILNELSKENPIGKRLREYSDSIPNEEKQKRINNRKTQFLKSFGGNNAPINPVRLSAFSVGESSNIPKTKKVLETPIENTVIENTPIPNYNKLAGADNISPAPITNTNVRITNDGITGDVTGMRERIQANRRQQFGLDGIHKQNPDGSYDTSGLNVKFNQGTDPEAAKAFLNSPTGGGLGPRVGFNPNRTTYGPRQLQQLGKTNELPSKEGLNRHQYQQLLENQGALDVQKERNLGSLQEQRLKDANEITTQQMRNEGLLDAQELSNMSTLQKQEILQNKAKIKNEQDIKDKNLKMLKDRHTLYQDRLKNFTGGDFTKLQNDAAKAAREYEKALNPNADTVVNSEDYAKKLLGK